MEPLGRWIATNGADLIGHALTLAVFLGGFALMRHQAKVDIAKDRATKYFDRCTSSVIRNTRLIETIRGQMFLLAVQPFDRQKPLTPEIERRTVKLSALRAELFASAVFVPPDLQPHLDRVLQSLTELNAAVRSGDYSETTRANDRCGQAIDEWQLRAREWMRELGDELQIWKKPSNGA